MMTRTDPATNQLVSAEQNTIELPLPAATNRRARRALWGFAVAGLVAAIAAAQVSPLQIIALAQGYGAADATLQVRGPSDVLQTDLIFQPGGTTGWHTHPGPVVVIVKTGALTEIHPNGCTTVHPAGSAFFEQPNEVHNVVNQTNVVTEVYATFLSPAVLSL